MRREDFKILNEQVHNRPLVYLDNAATTQKPRLVIDAISYAYEHFNANIHRAVHHLAQIATKEHENARQLVAQWLHADNEEIIFTKGTTDSINTLAFCFGEAFIHPGDEVIISALEHHSNIVPWQMMCSRKGAQLKVIPITEQGYINLGTLNTLITDHTRLISVAYVSNVFGTKQPVEAIIRLAHEHGIAVLVDAAQAAPHLAIDVKKLDCDFLALSAHKMYGPTGLGILYGKRSYLDQLPPYQGGGEMIYHVSFTHSIYNTLPYKFEAGTPNFVGSYAFGKTLEYIQSIGIDAIHSYESDLVLYMEQQLSQIEGVCIYAQNKPKEGVISFNVYMPSGQLIHPFDIGTLLDQQGIAVRTGHHCAEPLMDILGVPGTIRASIALYNNKEDIDAFIAALRKAITMLL